MSPSTHISDDPLPPADPVAPLEPAHGAEALAPHEEHPAPLEDPDMSPASSYGRTDPASLAALQSTELADPSLQAETAAELGEPDLNQASQAELGHVSLTAFSPGQGPADAAEQPEKPDAGQDFSNWDPHLAHLAQVGLTSADHWEEQIKPRIDQLQEDITQVNEQLDDLEKAKPKPKKS